MAATSVVLPILCKLKSQLSCGKVDKVLLEQVSEWMQGIDYFRALERAKNVRWASEDYTIRAAWSLLFAARVVAFNSARRSFVANSANCRFLIAPCSFYVDTKMNRDSASLFIKAVPYPTPQDNDAIFVDNVNGWIFNEICRVHPAFKPHFMTYIDSFLSYTNKKETKWKFDVLFDVTNPKSPFCVSSKHSTLPKCQVSISYALDGKPIMVYLKSACNNNPDVAACRSVMHKFREFYEVIAYLGLEWGFTHSDFHLGNLFFSKGHITCIDYGRVYFQKLADSQNDFVNEFVRKEAVKLGLEREIGGSITYKKAMSKYHTHLKSSHRANGKYPMHVADFMTLCGNMYFLFLAGGEKRLVDAVLPYVEPFFHVTATKENLFTRNNVLIRFPDDKACVEAYRSLRLALAGVHAEWRSFLSLVAEGLFLLSMMFVYYDNRTRKSQLNGSLRLHDRILVWTHFQYNHTDGFLIQFAGDMLSLAAADASIVEPGGCLEKMLAKPRRSSPSPMDTQLGGSPRPMEWEKPANATENNAQATRALSSWIHYCDGAEGAQPASAPRRSR